MQKRILIIGAGFAGVDAALSAARLRDLEGVSPDMLEILVVAPEPRLTIRPRLYEREPATLAAPLTDLFAATEIRFLAGTVETIDTASWSVTVAGADGLTEILSYDRLVLASGSKLFRPPVPGLAEYGFSVDQLAEAMALDAHLAALADRPDTPARNTVVVAGGGFTGIEAATEIPIRLRELLGEGITPRVVIVERAPVIARDMGDNPRALIEQALDEIGIETRLGVAVSAIDGNGVTLSSGERIDAATVIWSAGMRASTLTEQVAGERDQGGRLLVDAELRVPGVPGVFATGDTARAATDTVGNHSLMSCQHAKRLGAFAGNNAAAELLDVPGEAYHQVAYVTCLDLGSWGALFTRGWDRVVELTGPDAKKLKQEINTVWIYPPQPDRTAALAYAVPANVVAL